jgi:hypothetical protein
MNTRLVTAMLAVTAMVMFGAAPAHAAIADLNPIVKKLSARGYDCQVKPPVGGFREANCYKGDKYIHAVAFATKTVYGVWAPSFCDLSTVPAYVTNGSSWIVDSAEVSASSLRKLIGNGSIKKCPAG